MSKKIDVEVEGGELALKNSYGDMVIVPKYDRGKVQKFLDDGCDSCLDNYVESLPVLDDYAEDGTLETPQKVN